jgi:dTDP-4-dehydrorhamnose 3,5-epimerase
MEIYRTHLDAVHVLKPKIFEDARGSFMETYNMKTFLGLGIHVPFVQDNQSVSRFGVLRGLHYQLGRPQAKLIHVVEGDIYDVAVDIRPWSSTFGKWCSEHLSAAGGLSMFVPAGFAHGFLTLSERAVVEYKCSDYYSPSEECGILWNDPDLAIPWPSAVAKPIMKARDAAFPVLAKAQIQREYARGASMPTLSGRDELKLW